MAQFFEMFPDYEFACREAATAGSVVVLSGTVHMTWTGKLPRTLAVLSRLPRLPRRAIELPAVAVLHTRDGLLSHERFFFDMAEFSQQIGLPLGLLRAVLSRLQRQRNWAVQGRDEITVEQTAVVHAPADVVFDRALADVPQLMRANPTGWLRATRIELVDGLVACTGAARQVHPTNGHVTLERFEAFDRGRLLQYRIENGWGFPIDLFVAQTYGNHEVEAMLDGKSRITWRAVAVPRFRWAAPVVRLLMARLMRPMQRRLHASIESWLGAGLPANRQGGGALPGVTV